MGFIETLMIAVGLAMDAFAVSLAAGTSGRAIGRRAAFRLSFHFGLFQFMMPVIGWFLGAAIAPQISSFDHWIAFALLVFVGVRMIRSGFDDRAETFATDPSRGLALVVLAIATSIDALAIGLSLAMLRIKIWYPSAVIGLVTSGLSLFGLRMGTRLGARFGKRMEIVGGAILTLIGLRTLLLHLLA
ncbi:MAG: manganese efflux pump MntP family protein [Candidatus Methylomirabilota bacterium]|jgi:putative Mn2+ efflux pump MntP